MKKILLVLTAIATVSLTSCVTVPAGHKGVEISWGGKTNMNKVYPEGLASGLGWLWNDMEVYDVREHTMVKTYQFNDKDDMLTTVVLALDYNLSPLEVNQLHTKINDVLIKIETSLNSAAKEVVPQYSAVDLNKHERVNAENILNKILKQELPEFFVEFKRVRVTDVDFPKGISDLAAQTAVQLGKNDLASKFEQEKIFKANAIKAEAQGIADAKVITSVGDLAVARNEAKTRDLLSSSKMLALQRVENERIMAEGYKTHGKSFYGTNNIFGSNAAAVVKGLGFGKN